LFKRPSWKLVIVTGVFFGLAQATKFSALLLGPISGLLFLWRAFVVHPFTLSKRSNHVAIVSQTWWQKLLWLAAAGLVILIVAYLTLWGVYGFQVGPFPGTRWPVLAPTHFEQLLNITGRLAGETKRQTIAFLMGDLYVGGRWEYFPVAFLLKTPLPVLFCFMGIVIQGLSTLRSVDGRKRTLGRYVLWLPPSIFFASSLMSNLNLGYRYILPVLPFVLVMAGQAGQWIVGKVARSKGAQRVLLVIAAAILVSWSVWSGVSIWPHYLAFFNELAGGPDNGWRYLVDSNIDWGQDLKMLKPWMDTHSVERIKLGYVGEARPPYYGITFDPLPSSPDRWEHALHHDLYFADPAPGIYAISANLVQGRNLADSETYAWFRDREPVDKIGYSIFIYDVPARGNKQITLGLSGLVPNDIRPQDYVEMGTNDVHVMWFDEAHAMIFPKRELVLFAVDEPDVHPALRHLWPWQDGKNTTTRNGQSLQTFEGNPRDVLVPYLETLVPISPVWHLPANQFISGDPETSGERLTLPIEFGGKVELLACEMSDTVLHPDNTLTLVTYWQIQSANEKPLKLFVHLLDENGAYSGGQDRLDVWYENWRIGDMFAQVQDVAIDSNIKPGEYQIEIGWYNPSTMQRLQVTRPNDISADRVLLQPVTIESK
jgi:hypothetical protein